MTCLSLASEVGECVLLGLQPAMEQRCDYLDSHTVFMQRNVHNPRTKSVEIMDVAS
jgi:hypothetical protein